MFAINLGTVFLEFAWFDSLIATNASLSSRSLSVMEAVLQQVAGLASLVIGDECAQSLVVNMNLADTHCLSLSLSKALSLSVVAGAAVSKSFHVIIFVLGGMLGDWGFTLALSLN
jgi:hypothetical protein